jgi:glyoxylase-like metal-dependent hydrolase (beta-lactamase superfamily II)
MKTTTIEIPVQKNWFSVAPGIWGLRDIFVNIYVVHNPADGKWVLIDAGLKTTGVKIKQLAEELFWPDVRPAAIVLTHGHFDHVGSIAALAAEWEVPVYIHPLERPFLDGTSAYPPPDPGAGGGMMTLLSWLFPKGPINIARHLHELPADGSVPFLPGWTYLHTPGHAPGHISLFREQDRVLIAGDAFVTTRQESALSVMTQKKELTGPPRYFTCDWNAAHRSVLKLAALEPAVAATGHGYPMQGTAMRKALFRLADHFEQLSVPAKGRYTDTPALTDEKGVRYVPPKKIPVKTIVIGVSALVIAGYLLYARHKKKSSWS